MQWNVPRTMSRLTLRTFLEPLKAKLSDHHWSIKGPLPWHRDEYRLVWTPHLQKQWLHLPAVQCLAKRRNLLNAQPPQQGVLHQEHWEQNILAKRVLSSSATSQETPSEKKEEPDPLQDKSISLYQRFKKTFRQYGKVLIPVHLITSGIWFGTFYYAAIKGVNVIPFLEVIGLPDSVVDILKNSQSGNALTAYAMFKMTPKAGTWTGHRGSVKVKSLQTLFKSYSDVASVPKKIHVGVVLAPGAWESGRGSCFRVGPGCYQVNDCNTCPLYCDLGRNVLYREVSAKSGYMSTPPPVKEYLQDRMEETKELITEKMEETKDRLTEKLQETKEKVSFKKKVE